MATILVTGSSGTIGRRLVPILATNHRVVQLTRHEVTDGGRSVRGAFHSFEDLRKLDSLQIEVAVHLAAVGGGVTKEMALDVKRPGNATTSPLLIDGGCRKFVIASSIAAVGCLDPGFVPFELPIPDRHPCLATDAYGLSKALLEQLTEYFYRTRPELGFINLRLGAVEDESTWAPGAHGEQRTLKLPFLELGRVALGDVLRCVQAAVDAPHLAGVRTFNVVAPRASSLMPATVALRATVQFQLGGFDLLWFERPGHEYDPIYRIDAIKGAIDFTPDITLR
jgi:nucleoside-diphosphate-sugar epimerase